MIIIIIPLTIDKRNNRKSILILVSPGSGNKLLLKWTSLLKHVRILKKLNNRHFNF